MSFEDDEDLILQRASTTLLRSLSLRISNLLWKKNGSHSFAHRFARQRDVDDILALVLWGFFIVFTLVSDLSVAKTVSRKPSAP